MPRKPKPPYSYPGCPKLTDKRFCEEHEKLSNSNYEKCGRDKSTKKRYGPCEDEGRGGSNLYRIGLQGTAGQNREIEYEGMIVKM